MSFVYEYPRPAVTVDIILIDKNSSTLEILLIKRKHAPFEDCWALPGGFLDIDELLDDAALRELKEETSITGVNLTRFIVADKPGRDPRGRTISLIYYGWVTEQQKNSAKAADDAKELQWFSLNHIPPLAFDHHEIIKHFKNTLLSI